MAASLCTGNTKKEEAISGRGQNPTMSNITREDGGGSRGVGRAVSPLSLCNGLRQLTSGPGRVDRCAGRDALVYWRAPGGDLR
jgi:hypothetical protein